MLVDHMMSGDQLFTDTKLIRRLARAAGISDKKIDQIFSKDVSKLLLYIRNSTLDTINPKHLDYTVWHNLLMRGILTDLILS